MTLQAKQLEMHHQLHLYNTLFETEQISESVSGEIRLLLE